MALTQRSGTLVFVLLQAGLALAAISNGSLWIDEFWTAHFTTIKSAADLYDLLLIPSGSQTPLHFVYYYFWGFVFPSGELSLRLANLPLFVMGQTSLFWAARGQSASFRYFLLAVSALHPLVWQYANEARPYIMMYAGSQMIMAYIFNMVSMDPNRREIDPLFSTILVAGSILLFGASLLGAFWVISSFMYIAYFHVRYLDWRYLLRGVTLLLSCILLVATTLLAFYYLNSLLKGAGASRLASTTVISVLFAGYELLGLSGVGPGRLELRNSGLASLGPYWAVLIPACLVLLVTLSRGVIEAMALRGRREVFVLGVVGLVPVAIVISSGFAMHWRVLGRHLIAALPVLNIVFALGLAKLLGTGSRRRPAVWAVVGIACMATLIYSSFSIRFSDRHKKDDYRTAAAIALEETLQGGRVWWAADYVGANYYRLPGEFDFMGEITEMHKPPECRDLPGVQAVSNASEGCLRLLSRPSLIILSKPESFDRSGGIAAYLQSKHFAKVRDLQAFTVWRPAAAAAATQR